MTGITGKKKWTMMYKYLSTILFLSAYISAIAQFNVSPDSFSRVYNSINTSVYDEAYMEYMSKSTVPYLGEFVFNVSLPSDDGLDSLYGVVLFELDKGPVYMFSYAGDPYEGTDITMHDFIDYPVHIFEAGEEEWSYYDAGYLTYYTRGKEHYLEIKIGPIQLTYLP